MKIIKVIFLCIAISYTALCQNISHTKTPKTTTKADTTSRYFGPHPPDEKTLGLLTGEGYTFAMPNSIGFRVINKSDSSSWFYRGFGWELYRRYNAFIIPNHEQVEVCTPLVNPKNAANFRYRIVQNDERELVPWAQPNVFRSLKNGTQYAYLGKFNYNNRRELLKVELYDTTDPYNRYTILLDWREITRPRYSGSIRYVCPNWQPINGMLWSRSIYDTARTEFVRMVHKNGKDVSVTEPHKDFIESELSKDNDYDHEKIKFRLGDSLQNITFKNYSYEDTRIVGLSEPTHDCTVILIRRIQGHTDTIDLGNVSTNFELSKEFWKYPGDYTVNIVPDVTSTDGSRSVLPAKLTQTINFTMLPPLNVEQKVPLPTVILIVLGLLTAIGLAFYIYYNWQKRKLADEAKSRQIATLQLQSVRSQLNPHFIFNALASVQNLINKNAIEDANKYLVRFARLTRNVLDDEKKDLTTVEHEVNFLDDYLQMEQLRFGFKYTITVAADVDRQMEIPAMLLQPFVENAVKHGAASKKETGEIRIAIIKQGDNFILSVTDNGNGFGQPQTPGMGIKLCQDRVKLLNSIYKNTTITLKINPDKNGTEILITLLNWQ